MLVRRLAVRYVRRRPWQRCPLPSSSPSAST